MPNKLILNSSINLFYWLLLTETNLNLDLWIEILMKAMLIESFKKIDF